MAMEPRPSRSPTLRVLDLLSTRVQSVRIELVGSEGGVFARMGAVLVYLPLVLIGYLLILAALMKVIAAGIGWGMTFFVFGAIHLAVSAWGISRGRPVPGATKTYDVVDPEVAGAQKVAPPAAPQRAGTRTGTADTLPDVRSAAAAERPGVIPPMGVTPPPPVTVVPHPLQNQSRPPGLRGNEATPGRAPTSPGRSAVGTPAPASSAPSNPK